MRHILLAGLLVLFAIPLLVGQEEDFHTWISVGVKGEWFDLIDYSFAPELRLTDNSTSVESLLGEVDLSVPLTKFFRLGVEYRHELEFDNEANDHKNRMEVYTEFDESIGDLDLEYRALYMLEYSNINTSELGHLPESLHRHRIQMKYRQKGWDIRPSVAAEVFYGLNPVWIRNQQKIRLTGGIRYRLTKDINLGLSYKFQKEFNRNNPLTTHILSMGVGFEM